MPTNFKYLKASFPPHPKGMGYPNWRYADGKSEDGKRWWYEEAINKVSLAEVDKVIDRLIDVAIKKEDIRRINVFVRE